MATINELETANQLHKFDAELSWRDMEDRHIYVLPHVVGAMVNDLPSWAPLWLSEIKPHEQVYALLYDYCRGAPLKHQTQFHCLRNINQGVWELKTVDVRMFGFFYRKDIFICTDIDQKGNIAAQRSYSRYVAQAVAHRNALNLNPPSHVPGDDPNDVVSNWC
ncbi:hypothetical protein [Sphingomonas sp. YL-JM2C]